MIKKYHKQIGVGGLVISDREKELVNKVLDSNRLTYGKYSKKFEQMFANSHDCKYAHFMNSGTSALHIAVAALKEKYGWCDGDEIIVPAVTFIATSNVVLHNNLTPVFVDVDPRTYNIDPSKIEEKITNRTRAIIPVHLLGLPADMDEILSISDKYDLRIIEDSCETMFAKYKGRSVGSFGDVGCFSTYVAHFLVTGVGGLTTTNDPDIAVMIRSMMNHGRDGIYISCTDDNNKTGAALEEIVNKRFSFIHLGHSFRCTEIEAAIGVGQIERIDKVISKRKYIAERYNAELSVLNEYIQLPHVPSDRSHSYMLYPIVLRNERKNEFIYYLEELNIETRDLMPLINQPVYKKIFGDIENEYPVAKWLNRSGLYIGCNPYMVDDEVDFVIDAIKRYFQ